MSAPVLSTASERRGAVRGGRVTAVAPFPFAVVVAEAAIWSIALGAFIVPRPFPRMERLAPRGNVARCLWCRLPFVADARPDWSIFHLRSPSLPLARPFPQSRSPCNVHPPADAYAPPRRF